MLTQQDQKTAETLQDQHHGLDTRKQLNRAPDKRPGLTLADIAGGVDSEQIDNLGVPVFRYQTQITIHGIFPELSTAARFDALGYKSLVRNKNGSLGVRYTAIDANKKSIVSSALRLAGKAARYSVQSDSTGYSLMRYERTSEQAARDLRALLADLPAGCFVGGSGLYRSKSFYGDFLFIRLDIRAVPAARLWELVNYVTGGAIATEQEYTARHAERKAKQEQEQATYERERQEREQAQAVIDAAARADLKNQSAGLLVPVASPVIGKRYIMPGLFGWERRPGFKVLQYGKAFGKLTSKGKVFSRLQDAIDNFQTVELGKGKETSKFRDCFIPA